MKKTTCALLLLLFVFPVVSATTNDFSGNGYHLTSQGDPTLISASDRERGFGYAFDGNDCMSDNLETADRVGAFTYFVLADTPSSGGIAIGGRPQGSSSVGKGGLIQISGTGVSWSIGQGTGSIEGSAVGSITGPGPHAIAATYDDTSRVASLYINGTLVDQFTYSNPISWTDTSAGPSPGQFYVGGERSDIAGTACNVNFMTGNLWEIRTFGEVLDQETIALLSVCEGREVPVGTEVRFYTFGGTDFECPDAVADGGSLFGDDGLFYGGDKNGFANIWKLSVSALDMMYGVILILIFVGIAYKVSGENNAAAIGGGVAGMLFAFAFGLFQIWVAVFLIAVGLGLTFLKRRMGGAPDG